MTSRGDHAQNKGEPHGATYPCCRQEGHQGRARGHAYPPGPACPRSTVRSPLAVFPPKLNGLGTSVSVHCLVCSLCSLSPPRHRPRDVIPRDVPRVKPDSGRLEQTVDRALVDRTRFLAMLMPNTRGCRWPRRRSRTAAACLRSSDPRLPSKRRTRGSGPCSSPTQTIRFVFSRASSLPCCWTPPRPLHPSIFRPDPVPNPTSRPISYPWRGSGCLPALPRLRSLLRGATWAGWSPTSRS